MVQRGLALGTAALLLAAALFLMARGSLWSGSAGSEAGSEAAGPNGRAGRPPHLAEAEVDPALTFQPVERVASAADPTAARREPALAGRAGIVDGAQRGVRLSLQRVEFRYGSLGEAGERSLDGRTLTRVGPRREVETRADGTFEVQHLDVGEYAIESAEPELVVAPECTVAIEPEPATCRAELALEAAQVLRGLVVDRDGRPLRQAQVVAYAAASGPGSAALYSQGARASLRQVEADERGAFAIGGLARQRYRLLAWRDDVGTSDETSVAIPAAASVTLAVLGERGVHVRVRDALTGAAVAGARVQAHSIWPLASKRLASGAPKEQQATAAADGTVDLRLAAAGIVLTATADGYEDLQAFLRGAALEGPIELFLVPSGCSCVVVLDGESLRPVVGASVACLWTQPGAPDDDERIRRDPRESRRSITPSGSERLALTTDAQGVVRLPLEEGDRQSALALCIEAPGYAPELLAVRQGGKATRRLVKLFPVARLTLTCDRPERLTEDTVIRLRDPLGGFALDIGFQEDLPVLAGDAPLVGGGPRVSGDRARIVVEDIPSGNRVAAVGTQPSFATRSVALSAGDDVVLPIELEGGATIRFAIEAGALEPGSALLLGYLGGGDGLLMEFALNYRLPLEGPGPFAATGIPPGNYTLVSTGPTASMVTLVERLSVTAARTYDLGVLVRRPSEDR